MKQIFQSKELTNKDIPKGLTVDTDSAATRDQMTFNATNNAYFDDILKTDSSLAKEDIESNQEATPIVINTNSKITDYMDDSFRDNDVNSMTGNFLNDLRSETD